MIPECRQNSSGGGPRSIARGQMAAGSGRGRSTRMDTDASGRACLVVTSGAVAVPIGGAMSNWSARSPKALTSTTCGRGGVAIDTVSIRRILNPSLAQRTCGVATRSRVSLTASEVIRSAGTTSGFGPAMALGSARSARMRKRRSIAQIRKYALDCAQRTLRRSVRNALENGVVGQRSRTRARLTARTAIRSRATTCTSILGPVPGVAGLALGPRASGLTQSAREAA
jgi:hypothetical protein